jgi:hypothetical protein
MSSTLLEPATTIRCSFEQPARAIIDWMIRSFPRTSRDWVMTLTIQVNIPIVAITRIIRHVLPTRSSTHKNARRNPILSHKHAIKNFGRMSALFLVCDWTTSCISKSYAPMRTSTVSIATKSALCSISCTYQNGWDSTSNSYARMCTLAARIESSADRSGFIRSIRYAPTGPRETPCKTTIKERVADRPLSRPKRVRLSDKCASSATSINNPESYRSITSHG